MNISLNVICEGASVHVTAVYNFKQVNDAILLKIYNTQEKPLEDLFVKYVDGVWLPEHFSNCLTVETFRQIDKELTKTYNLHKNFGLSPCNDAQKKICQSFTYAEWLLQLNFHLLSSM